MKTFRIFLSLLTLVLLASKAAPLSAQSPQEGAAPKWAAKMQKSLVSVLSYDANNELLRRGTGIYVDDRGTVVAPYSLLKGAYAAQVVDMGGRQYKVTHVLGADDTYDLVKLQTEASRSEAVRMAPSTAGTAGSRVYSLGYSKRAATTCPSTTVAKKEVVLEKYAYYTLATALPDTHTGSALFSEDGLLLGIVQSPVGGRSGAIDAAYGRDLSISALQTRASSLALSGIHLPKGLPDSMEESLVYLYFQSRAADNDSYMDMLNQFVERWPDNPEGYYRRVTPELDLARFDEADRDLNTYLRLAPDPMVAHANAAQTIHSKLLYQPDKPYEKWTYELALQHNDEALRLARQRMAQAKTDSLREDAEAHALDYQLMRARIFSARQDYAAALAIYNEVNAGPHRAPATLYAASMAREAAGDSVDICIALMDSAIALMPQPLTQEAASYVMRRGQLLAAAGRYRAAVADYNRYDTLLRYQVNAQFYYDRALLEQQARMFQQSLDDLNRAIEAQPAQALYYVEKSALLLRVNMLDECMEAARRCIELNPSLFDAYRILGYAQIQKGDKAAARANLEKAVGMGDTQAQELIDQFLQ